MPNPMKLYVRTFGCQMNFHDSTHLAEMMGLAGYEMVDDYRSADVLIVNTCSVREKAWHKAISETGRYCALKKTRPGLVVALTGCVAQQEGNELFKKLPALDLVLGPDHYQELPAMIEQIRQENSVQAKVGFDQGGPGDFHSLTDESVARPALATVTVMKGCSERCRYCIVPSVRGNERSRPADDIVREVELLVRGGAREIMLLGQKVNGYHRDNLTFAGLLKRIDGISGLERLRFTSPHPRHMDEELIEAFGSLNSLCESIHLPVQSGSDRTLKRMGRRYDSATYRDIARRLRFACPGILISTDLIVGFPGETDSDFMETMSLLEEVRFSGVFSFKYSPRPGTRAADMPDDVPMDEKVRRLAVAHEVIDRIEREIKDGLVGQKYEVLVSGPARKPGKMTGRARNNQIINFVVPEGVDADRLVGHSVEIFAERSLPHCLDGRLILP
jgi:tRNA-2-methylthio-N6-dimethylallyladenosine synthase